MVLPDNIECKKVKSEEELKIALVEHQQILTQSTIDYLGCLIDLKFSAIKGDNNIKTRELLQTLGLYHDIVSYNIYNRTLSILNNSHDLLVYDNEDGMSGLKAYKKFDETEIKIFDYDYETGKIELYQTIENEIIREQQIELVNAKIEKLRNQYNPHGHSKKRYGGVSSSWNFNRMAELNTYENMLKQLSRKDFKDIAKEKVEATRRYQELLFEEYGLNNDSFDTLENASIAVPSVEQIGSKVLVKKLPELRVEHHIEYV